MRCTLAAFHQALMGIHGVDRCSRVTLDENRCGVVVRLGSRRYPAPRELASRVYGEMQEHVPLGVELAVFTGKRRLRS